VVYGWYHRRSLQATHNEHKLRDATHHRERLIVQAKEAWKRKQESAKGATRMFFSSLNLAGYMKDAHISLAVIMDPDDPSFNLEKLLLHLEKTDL
jgi:F-type H+-transporting ATP synthase subunit e